MKIISKYHDYYDDIAYVCGVDDRLILSRPSVITSNKETDWRGNKNVKIEMVGLNLPSFNFDMPSNHKAVINGRFYDFKKFEFRLFCFFGRFCIKYTAKDNVEFKVPASEDVLINRAHLLLKTPVFEIMDFNFQWESHLKTQFGDYKDGGFVASIDNNVPTLKSTGIDKIIPAEKMYSIAEQWARNQKTNEGMVSLSNTDRVIKAGFDLKRSFRPNLC